MKRLAFSLVLFCSLFAAAQPNQSIASGNWSSPANWSLGHAPTSTEDVIVHHIMIIDGASCNARSLTIDAGARVWANGAPGTRRLYISGNMLLCNGILGDPNTSDVTNINISTPNLTITGTGQMAVRSLSNSTLGPQQTSVQMNIRLWSTGSAVYNEVFDKNSNPVTSDWMLLINAGFTLDASAGTVQLDPLSAINGENAGGTITVAGTLKCATLDLRKDNQSQSCTIAINNGGIIETGSANTAAVAAAGNHALTIAAGGKLTFTSGNWGTLAAPNTYTLNTGSTVEFSANANQHINAPGAYSNLVLSNSGAGNSNKTLSAGITVNNKLTMTGKPVLINNGFTITYGNTSTLEYLNFTLANLGSEINNGVRNLTINTGITHSLTANIEIPQVLTLQSGKLQLGSFNLTIGNNGSITGSFSGSTMIVTNGTGSLVKRRTIAGSFTYPVGDVLSHYTPVMLFFTSGSFSNATVSVNVKNFKQPNNPFTTNHLNRHWTITQTGITGFSCDLVFEYADADINGAEHNILPARWTGSLWQVVGTTNTAGNSLFVTTSSFSDFTGISNQILPVQLAGFKATPHPGYVLLEWETADEDNNAGFYIERQKGNGWESIGFVSANTSHSYQYKDHGAKAGPNYYRLKQVDIDNGYAYSVIRRADLLPVETIRIGPNPFRDKIAFRYNLTGAQQVQVSVWDASGRRIAVLANGLQQPGDHQLTWNALNMPKGLYYFHIDLDQTTISKPVVKME